MNESVMMSVSSVTRKDDKKAVYVMFTDGSSQAELAMPQGTLISCRGFSESEIKQLTDYALSQKDLILQMAREVNPLKAMLKERSL